MKYYVVNEGSIEDLIEKVQLLLDKGAVLVGGVSCSISESDDYYYAEYSQALTLKT
jgi:hypothetical protein